MATMFTLILGIVFIAVATLGALSGGHAHTFMGFGVNAMHHMVHLISGLAAIAVSRVGESAARKFCYIFGAIYGLVSVAGFLNVPAVVGLMNINTADNWLHLAISAGCFIAAYKSARIEQPLEQVRH